MNYRKNANFKVLTTERSSLHHKTKTMLTSLDKDDILILRFLQHHGRITNKEIADKIGKSVSPVYERIKKLENDGIILQYVELLDRHKIDRNLSAYVNVQLKEHAANMMTTFEQEVIKLNEVMECYHMTGQYDYLLKVVVKDMGAYYEFMIDKLSTLKNVGTVQSFFVLNEAKKELGFRLDDLMAAAKQKQITKKEEARNCA